MVMVVITPKKSASIRTKNRIREHGPAFMAKLISSSVLSMGHGACVSLESTDGWFGWLPLAEIEGVDVDAVMREINKPS